MAVARVQAWTNTTFGSTSNTATSGSSVTAGNLVEVATFTCSGSGICVPTAPGYTFVQVTNHSSGGGTTEAVYWAIAPSSGSLTVTITNASGSNIELVCGEYSGCAGTGPVQHASGDNVFAGATGVLASNTTTGNLVTFASMDSFNGIATSSSTQGTVSAGVAGGYNGATDRGADWQIATAAALTGTENGSRGYNIIIVTEYAAAGGGGGGGSDVVPMIGGGRRPSNSTYIKMRDDLDGARDLVRRQQAHRNRAFSGPSFAA